MHVNFVPVSAAKQFIVFKIRRKMVPVPITVDTRVNTRLATFLLVDRQNSGESYGQIKRIVQLVETWLSSNRSATPVSSIRERNGSASLVIYLQER
jgi:hypothetical protein